MLSLRYLEPSNGGPVQVVRHVGLKQRGGMSRGDMLIILGKMMMLWGWGCPRRKKSV